MRPQGFGQMGAGLEDLGWNDMGFDPPRPAPASESTAQSSADVVEHPVLHGHAGLTPVHSPVHSQQAEIVDSFTADDKYDEDEAAEEAAEIHVPEVQASAAPKPVVPPAPAPAPRRSPRPRAAPGSKGKAAFTLRLDPQRHLKLRLACAVNGRSAQQLVTDALDQLLAGMPELEGLAEKAKRNG
jgi:hypothetical protein